MIAATRDTSTKSTPTPIAVTARRSEAEPSREPCRGREVAAQHQSEPYQRHGERRPQHDQRPKRRPPARNGVDLVGPATVLLSNLRLEREPRDLETARGGAERLLPLRVRRLVENAGLAHVRGDRIERIERGHERFAAGGQPGGDRPLLGAREAAAAQSSRHANAARGPLDLSAERGGHALARPAHRGFPRGEPGAPAHRVEHAVAILARGGGPGFAAQLYHARRELFANVVERYPRLLQAPGHEDPAERGRELRNAQRHGDLHRRAHRARRAARPVRASYWATKYGSDSGRKRSRATPVAAIARSISDGSPSTSSNTSIAGYHSRRSTAWPSRYTSTRRSMRTDTAYPSCSRMVTTESGDATRASASARWRYLPRWEGGPFHPSTPSAGLPSAGRNSRSRST